MDRELALDLKAEIVRQARATVERVQDADHLSDAIRADIHRLMEINPHIALEGGAAFVSEIYYDAFEESVNIRAENEEIYRQAAALITEEGGEEALSRILSNLEGKIALDGTLMGDKFQAAFKREQELYQLLVDKMERASFSESCSQTDSPARGRLGFDIRSELNTLSNDPGFKALVRRQEIKTKLSNILNLRMQGSLKHDTGRTGDGAFLPGTSGGVVNVLGSKLKSYTTTSLLALIIGLGLLLKRICLALLSKLLELFR